MFRNGPVRKTLSAVKLRGQHNEFAVWKVPKREQAGRPNPDYPTRQYNGSNGA